MFGFAFSRRVADRTPRKPVVRRAAMLEPLESRQLLSATLAPADATGVTVALVKSTLPTAVLSGSKIKGSITIQLTNSGTTKDTGANAFNVYASTDAIVDPLDRSIGALGRKLNLGIGKTTRITIPVKSQAAPAEGTYDILIAATDPTGNTSTTAVTPEPSLTVAPATIQLVPVVGAPSPTALTPGKTITFKVTITNTGNTNSTGTLTTAIGLSPDRVNITTPLISKSRKATIKANFKALPLTFRVKIPAGTAAGAYYPSVTVTQGTAAQVVAFSTTQVTVGA